MTAFTSAGTGNWSDGSKWSGGSGSDYPGSAGAGDTVVIGAHTMTLDATAITALASNSLASITGNNASSILSVGSNATITLTGSTGITYSSSSTSGFVQITDNKLTLVGAGAGTTTVANTSTGYCIVASGDAELEISNSGGTAVSQASTGRTISWGSTGTLTVTGAVANSVRTAIYVGAAGTVNITGNISHGNHISFGTLQMSATGSTATINGDLGGDYNNGPAILLELGTVNWTGSRTVAASKECFLMLNGGTFNMATASAALVLANSGTVLIRKGAAAILNTADAGAGAASIVNKSATSYAVISGGTDSHKSIITGASIPSAADTRYGVTRGWADGATGATAGCGVAGGNGLLEIPNEGTPTGTQDETSDALVKTDAHYGSPVRHGTLAAGGGTGGYVPVSGGGIQGVFRR